MTSKGKRRGIDAPRYKSVKDPLTDAERARLIGDDLGEAHVLEPEEIVEPAPRKVGRNGFWPRLLAKHVMPLQPGERVELSQRQPPKWPPPRFLEYVRLHIRKYVNPVSPWRYECRLTARMTVLVSVLP